MKIAIAAKGKDLNSEIDERFGRADYFLITDAGGTKIEEIIDNLSKNDQTGAGIGAAKLIAEKGAEILVAGNLGPKAEDVLNTAGVKFISLGGSVLNALNSISNNEIQPENISSPKIGQDADFSRPGTDPQQDFPGRGMGRGKGGCRGGGSGMGRGQGGCRGKGSGMGRGMGRNMGRGRQ